MEPRFDEDRDRLFHPDIRDRQLRLDGVRWAKQEDALNWSPFKKELADGFGDLCAYCAMWISSGTVDHFIVTVTRARRS